MASQITTATERALRPLILLHIAKQSRHYLPEVTPWTIFHCQKGNVVNQKVHLLRNFTGFYYIGMVQPKHMESWMKTLDSSFGRMRQQTVNQLCFMFQVQLLFPKHILAKKHALQLVPTSIQMHKTRTLGIHKPGMRTKDISKSRYRNLMMGIQAQVLDSCTFLAKSLYTCICFYTWEQFPCGPRVSQESVNTCVTVLER